MRCDTDQGSGPEGLSTFTLLLVPPSQAQGSCVACPLVAEPTPHSTLSFHGGEPCNATHIRAFAVENTWVPTRLSGHAAPQQSLSVQVGPPQTGLSPASPGQSGLCPNRDLPSDH